MLSGFSSGLLNLLEPASSSLKPLYAFSFSLIRRSRRAVKPIAFPLEIKVVERAVFVLVDGHGASLRVRRS
jgi:hypothetical protein